MTSSEAFTTACGFVLPFGKYKGTHIARIGANDEGLSYLMWLHAEKEKEGDDGPVFRALATYLAHPAIARQLDVILENAED